MNINSICIYIFYSIYIIKEENMLYDLEVSRHHSWFFSHNISLKFHTVPRTHIGYACDNIGIW